MANIPKLKRGVLDSITDAIGNTPIVKLNNLTEELEAEISAMWEEVHAGYEDAIKRWFENDFFREVVNQVYFGLTTDGYFVAYIPESWDDIIFDTGIVYGEDTYGRLILRWDVDNSGDNINQRPEDWR